MGILAEATLAVQYMYHQTKAKNSGKLCFGRDMILPINKIANRRLIHQRKQSQIEKNVIRKKFTRIDYNCRDGDQIIIKKNTAFKYET